MVFRFVFHRVVGPEGIPRANWPHLQIHARGERTRPDNLAALSDNKSQSVGRGAILPYGRAVGPEGC